MPKTEHNSEKLFFIGANTSGGFVGYMNEILCGLEKVYIIKGGPGTGKSTLMKKIAKSAKEKGFEPELYYCSSDSDSLDGVVIRSVGVGIIDGTSPHCVDPQYPGAREEIINLGEFWDSDKLKTDFSAIKDLSDRKGELFETVYKYLSVCKGLHAERERMLRGCIDYEKAERAAARLMRHMTRGENFALLPRQISAIGMNGVTVLDTYKALSREYWYINDARGMGGLFCEMLVKAAQNLSLEVWVSRNPLLEIDALYFPDSGIAVFCAGEEKNASRIINTERFIIKNAVSERRAGLRFLSRIEKELLSRTMSVFEEIKKCHFAIEDIYKSAMDFSQLDIVFEKLLKKIL